MKWPVGERDQPLLTIPTTPLTPGKHWLLLMPYLEADLPLAIPTQQRILELGSSDDKQVVHLQQNLSAIAAPIGMLWLGGDEHRSLYRLRQLEQHSYGAHVEVKLKDFGLAGRKKDGESDIEGLALDGQRLWVVGSHSLRRRKHRSKQKPLSLHDKQSRNAHVLGCLRLDSEGQPVAGQRLAFNAKTGRDLLYKALKKDRRIAPFLKIPSKDNGLDIEGIAARNERLLVGLRGPVLRGVALVVDLRLNGLDEDGGAPLTLNKSSIRYLKLRGLAVRDLAVVPDSNDVLILAGPTMTLTGPCYLYRWRDAFNSDNSGLAEGVPLEKLEPLLRIRDDHPGLSEGGSDKPEGLEVQRLEGHLLALVAYDNPTRNRAPRGKGVQGVRTKLDGFLVPE